MTKCKLKFINKQINELESRLIILLAHLLKWQEFKGDSWRTTIIEQRLRLKRRLRKSPGLKSKLPAIINNVL